MNPATMADLPQNHRKDAPRRVALRLHDANSSGGAASIFKNEISKEFDNLRSDFTKYL